MPVNTRKSCSFSSLITWNYALWIGSRLAYAHGMFILLYPAPSCAIAGTLRLQPRASCPTVTNSHNLLPTILASKNQIANVPTESQAPEWNTYHYVTITELQFGEVVLLVFVCTCVCGLTSGHILPEHQHGHLGDTHSFLICLPAFGHLCVHSLLPCSHRPAIRYRLMMSAVLNNVTIVCALAFFLVVTSP